MVLWLCLTLAFAVSQHLSSELEALSTFYDVTNGNRKHVLQFIMSLLLQFDQPLSEFLSRKIKLLLNGKAWLNQYGWNGGSDPCEWRSPLNGDL